MLYTGARERKAETERGRHGEKTKERHWGRVGGGKRKNLLWGTGKTKLKKMLWRLRRHSQCKCNREISRQADKQTGRQADTTSIKSLDQSREETDETVWEQCDAAIGLIDLQPNSIKEWRDPARGCSHHFPLHCHCPRGGLRMCPWQRFIRNDSWMESTWTNDFPASSAETVGHQRMIYSVVA